MGYFAVYDSPIGPLLLGSDGEHLTGLWMKELPADCGVQAELPVFVRTKVWLDRYFRGENPPREGILLKPAGTAFQQQVWKLLLDIPWGGSRTYGELARDMAQILGKEKMSAQAVGQAVGSNPISILIPCHRCVGAKGRMTGYEWGIDKKVWLLRHEGWHWEETK